MLNTLHSAFFNYHEATYYVLAAVCNEVWKEPHRFFVLYMSKDKNYSW